MENTWIKAENAMLKEEFARIEAVLINTNRELLATHTQLKLAECRRVEQVSALE